MKSRLHKKGQVLDLVMNPLFTIAVGVMVIAVVMLAINKMGSSTEFQKKFYSTDVALQTDALYAVHPGINFETKYEASAKFGFIIDPKKVIVYEKEKKDGQAFYFTEDPYYVLNYGEYKPKRQDANLYFFRAGNQIGIKTETINLAQPYCEPTIPAKMQITIDNQAIQEIGTMPVTITTGELLTITEIKTGEPTIKIYTNNNEIGEQIACKIVQAHFKTYPTTQGYTIIPINPTLIAPDDPRREITRSRAGLYVEITLPAINPQDKTLIGQNIISAVKNYV